jgi:hypothetical protein
VKQFIQAYKTVPRYEGRIFEVVGGDIVAHRQYVLRLLNEMPSLTNPQAVRFVQSTLCRTAQDLGNMGSSGIQDIGTPTSILDELLGLFSHHNTVDVHARRKEASRRLQLVRRDGQPLLTYLSKFMAIIADFRESPDSEGSYAMDYERLQEESFTVLETVLNSEEKRDFRSLVSDWHSGSKKRKFEDNDIRSYIWFVASMPTRVATRVQGSRDRDRPNTQGLLPFLLLGSRDRDRPNSSKDNKSKEDVKRDLSKVKDEQAKGRKEMQAKKATQPCFFKREVCTEGLSV